MHAADMFASDIELLGKSCHFAFVAFVAFGIGDNGWLGDCESPIIVR